MGAAALGEPGPLLVQRAGEDVEGDGRGLDLERCRSPAGPRRRRAGRGGPQGAWAYDDRGVAYPSPDTPEPRSPPSRRRGCCRCDGVLGVSRWRGRARPATARRPAPRGGPAGDRLVLGEEDDLQVADEARQQLEEQRYDGGLELVERLVEQDRRAGAGDVGGGVELRHDGVGQGDGVVVGQVGGARRQRPQGGDVLPEPGRGLDLGAVLGRPAEVDVAGQRPPRCRRRWRWAPDRGWRRPHPTGRPGRRPTASGRRRCGGAAAQVVGGDAGDRRLAELAAEQVDPAVVGAVLLGDVDGGGHVDHPVVAGRRAQDHQAPAGVVDDLGVDAPGGAVQGAGQEVAERRTGIGRHPSHDGEPRMEVHGRGALFTFDDQSFHQHGLSIGASRTQIDNFL